MRHGGMQCGHVLMYTQETSGVFWVSGTMKTIGVPIHVVDGWVRSNFGMSWSMRARPILLGVWPLLSMISSINY